VLVAGRRDVCEHLGGASGNILHVDQEDHPDQLRTAGHASHCLLLHHLSAHAAEKHGLAEVDFQRYRHYVAQGSLILVATRRM
jgi:hypothetical protein